jgi:hypothetical protein
MTKGGAHQHQLHMITVAPIPDSARQLMGCRVSGCVYTEMVCADCLAEGRKESVVGRHTHAPDGKITRALPFLPKVRTIKKTPLA